MTSTKSATRPSGLRHATNVLEHSLWRFDDRIKDRSSLMKFRFQFKMPISWSRVKSVPKLGQDPREMSSKDLEAIKADPRFSGVSVGLDPEGIVVYVRESEVTPAMVEAFTDYHGYGYVLWATSTQRRRILNGLPPRFVSLSKGGPGEESFVGDIPSLEALNLDVGLTESVDLSALSRLKTLNMREDSPRFTGVFENKALEIFRAEGLTRGHFEELGSHLSLRTLDLRRSKLRDVSSLGNLKNLRFLNIAFMKGVNDFSWVANCTNLEHLWIEYNGPIEDTSFLRHLPRLKELRMQSLNSNTIIEDIAGLRSLGTLSLRALMKRETPEKPASLEPLRGHPKLCVFVAEGPWHIESVEPLAECPELAHVSVEGTGSKVANTSIEELIKAPKIRFVKIPGSRRWTSPLSSTRF